MLTLAEIEQEEDIDPVEYPDFLEGEELKKFHAKYKFRVIDTTSPNRDWWERNRPNGSYAFRFD